MSGSCGLLEGTGAGVERGQHPKHPLFTQSQAEINPGTVCVSSWCLFLPSLLQAPNLWFQLLGVEPDYLWDQRAVERDRWG
jgi:hypothetical protein